MTVKEILLMVARQLGIYDELQAYLNGTNDDMEEEAKLLLQCFQLIENELALDYFPLMAQEYVTTQSGSITFFQLSRSIVRVMSIIDENGQYVDFQLFPTYIKTNKEKVYVRYTYTPMSKSFTDRVEVKLSASPHMFIYGVLAEYSLAKGQLEEAGIWDKKYKDAIAASYRMTNGKRMPVRGWI